MELIAVAIAFVVSLGVGLTASRVALWAIFFFMIQPAAQYDLVITPTTERVSPPA